MTPDEYCQQKAAASGSSFYYSFLFLPQERRRAITALYAFCREVDDVVDETAEMQIAAAKLAWWRAEVANLYRGNPQHPVTRALAPFIGEYSLPQEHLRRHLCDAAFQGLLRFQVGRARRMMLEGKPLVDRLEGRLRMEIAITVQGGLRILEKLEQAGYDMFRHRPVHRWLDWPMLFLRAL